METHADDLTDSDHLVARTPSSNGPYKLFDYISNEGFALTFAKRNDKTVLLIQRRHVRILTTRFMRLRAAMSVEFAGNEFIFRLERRGAHRKNGILRFPAGPRDHLFAVADGMGGAAAGEMASKLCLKTLYHEVQELIQEARQPDEGLLEEILIEAVGTANNRIYGLGSSNHEYAGMGTTLTTVLELDGSLLIGQVGDSRAYLLRQGQIRQLTRDQSLVGQKVSEGIITEEEARRHPERNLPGPRSGAGRARGPAAAGAQRPSGRLPGAASPA
jgi:hypothetical protein